MADHSDNPQDLDASAALNGAGDAAETPADSSTDSPPKGANPADRAREKFEPKAYYFGAWHLIKQDMFLFLWKLGADVVRAGFSFAIFAMIGVVVAAGLVEAVAAPQGALFGLERFGASVATPGFVIGVAGVLLCGWLIGLMIDVLVLSGLWGTLAQGARGEPIARFRTFFAHLSSRFPEVLGLRITTLAAQLMAALLGLTVFVSVLVATSGDSAFAGSSIWARGLLWATPLTLLAGLVALIRLTMEVAAAPLLLERRTLGDAILTAAVFVTRRFAEVYRLLIVAASLLLVPLFLYWGVLIFGNLTMDVAALAPLNALMRLAGEAFLFVSSGAIAVLFYAAIFLYYAHQMGMIDEIPGRGDDQGANEPTGEPAAPGGRRSGRVGFDQDTRLEDLLPDDYPNIVELTDVLKTELSQQAGADDLDSASDAQSEPEPSDTGGSDDANAGDGRSDDGRSNDSQPGDANSGDDVFDSDPDPNSHDRD